MFRFIKQIVVSALIFFDSLSNVNSLECRMSRTNETRHIKWHETCKCICRLNEIICNNKQRWN